MLYCTGGENLDMGTESDFKKICLGLQKTSNKLIFIGKQIDIDETNFPARLRELRDAAEQNKESVAVAALHEMVPTFITPEEFNKAELAKQAAKEKKEQAEPEKVAAT